MFELYKKTKEAFNKTKNQDIVINLLEYFGFKFNEDIKNRVLTTTFINNTLEVYDCSDNPSKYVVTLNEDGYTTIHQYETFFISREYVLGIDEPINCCMGITNDNKEKLYFLEATDGNVKSRQIIKTIEYNDSPVTIFEKKWDSLIYGPEASCITTNTFDFQNSRNVTRTDNLVNFYYFDHKESGKDGRIETAFIQKPSSKEKGFKKENVFSTSYEKINTAILAIRRPGNEDEFTKLIVTKDRDLIEIDLYAMVNGKEKIIKNKLLGSNTYKSFSVEDLGNIIKYVKSVPDMSPIILKELKQVDDALVKNTSHEKAKSDALDLFLAAHEGESFDKLAFEIFCQQEQINDIINGIVNRDATKNPSLVLIEK